MYGDKKSKENQISVWQDANKISDLDVILKRLDYLESRLPKPLDDPHQSLLEEVVTYSEHSTWHGLHYIIDPSSRFIRKFIWGVLFAGCVIAYIYFATIAILRYYSYPIVSNTQYNYVNKLDIPTITICHTALIKASYYNTYLLNNPEPPDLEDHIIKGGHQFSDIVHSNVVEYPKGVEFKVDLVSSLQQIDEQPMFCHKITNYDNGNLSQMQEGSGALHMALNFNSPEILDQSDVSIKISFHSTDELPTQSFYLYPDAEYFFTLQVKLIKNLGKPYSRCIDSKRENFENPLSHYPHYSRTACKMECHSRKMKEECGCTPIGYPFRSEVPYCQAKNKSLDNCVGRVKLETDCSECQPACESTVYTVEVGEEREPKGEDGAEINIQFKEFVREEVIQSAGYPPVSLFGDLGGQLGLFLGASLLTIVEMLDLALVRFCRRKCHKLAKPVNRIVSTSVSSMKQIQN